MSLLNVKKEQFEIDRLISKFIVTLASLMNGPYWTFKVDILYLLEFFLINKFSLVGE